MSKSLDNHIELAATPEEIRRRVMQMVTDPARRYRHDPGHPEICNVFALHKVFAANPSQIPQIEVDCRAGTLGCVEHKRMFAEDLIRALTPLRERRAELAKDPQMIWDILEDGAARAREIAQGVLREAKDAVGLP